MEALVLPIKAFAGLTKTFDSRAFKGMKFVLLKGNEPPTGP